MYIDLNDDLDKGKEIEETNKIKMFKTFTK